MRRTESSAKPNQASSSPPSTNAPASRSNASPPSKPHVHERTERPSLLKQVETLFSRIALRIDYVRFKAAVRNDSKNDINYFVDHRLNEAVQNDVTNYDEVITLAIKRNNAEPLKRMLAMDDASGKIAKHFESVLRSAIKDGDMSRVNCLAKAIGAAKPDILSNVDGNGRTVLALAILKGETWIAERLIRQIEKHGTAEAYAADKNNISPLEMTIDLWGPDGVSTLKFLLSAKKANFSHTRKCNALLAAISENRFTAAEMLFRTDPNVLAEGGLGREALSEAISNENRQMFELILRHWSPQSEADFVELISLAAEKGRSDMVELLARAACDAKISAAAIYGIFNEVLRTGDEFQMQALFDGGLTLNEAERKKLLAANEELVDTMKNCIRVGEADIKGAILNNNFERVHHFIKKRGELGLNEHKDAGNWLLLAAQKNHREIFDALIEAGAPINSLAEDNSSVLMWLVKKGHSRAIRKVIEKSKADGTIDRQNKDGVTALMIAAANGYIKAVQALLHGGADLLLEVKDKRTALHLAIQRNKEKVIAELFKKYTPSVPVAQELLQLAIDTRDARTLELVARKLLKVLDKPEDVYAAFESVSKGNYSFPMFEALLNAGFKPSKAEIAKLFPNDKSAAQHIANYKRPPSSFVLEAIERGEISRFGAMDFNYRMDRVGSEEWTSRFNRQSTTHPVKAFLESRPPLLVSKDVEAYLGGIHPAVVSALRSTRSEEQESFTHLLQVIGQPELRLRLVDNHTGASLQDIDGADSSRLKDQLYAIAINRNSMLHEILNSPCPDKISAYTDKRAENQRAAWLQAEALVKENANFSPYTFEIQWDVDVASIEKAVAEQRLPAADALFQIESEIEKLEAVSDRFVEMLESGLPETLQHWLGNKVVGLLAQREKLLESARARMVTLLTACE